MGVLGPLLCGHCRTDGKAKNALDQLSRSIDSFAEKALHFIADAPSDDSRSFGPFCARVVLENGCAALVGRLDCFRLMYLSEFQTQPQFPLGKRARSAFSWLGDVVPDEKLSQDLWNPEHDVPKINRALFSRYTEHIYWRPAVERMLDFVASRPTDPAFIELLAFDAESYIETTRGRSLQLYSILSKGVHWEFFSTSLLFDDATVITLLRDTVMLVAHLGLTSHFIPTAYASLEPSLALDSYLALRRQIT